MLPSYTLIVASDAGGAEALIHYILGERLLCKFALEGAAERIFKRYLGQFKNENVYDVIDKVSAVLTGTSWASDTELLAIAEAKKRGIPSQSLLDHWVHFDKRFTRGKFSIYPDEVLVTDNVALDIAQNSNFPCKVSLVVNHLRNFVLKRKAKQHFEEINYLFISEPLYKFNQAKGLTTLEFGSEFDLSIANQLENLVPKNRNLIIRRHPSQLDDEDLKFLKYLDRSVLISKNEDIFDDLKEAKTVLGFRSTALVLALWMDKKVISLLPKQHPESIPIERLMFN